MLGSEVTQQLHPSRLYRMFAEIIVLAENLAQPPPCRIKKAEEPLHLLGLLQCASGFIGGKLFAPMDRFLLSCFVGFGPFRVVRAELGKGCRSRAAVIEKAKQIFARQRQQTRG